MKESEIKARLRGIELAIECRAFYEEFAEDLPNNITLPRTGGGSSLPTYTTGKDSFLIRENIAKIWAKCRKKEAQ
jgi:hypothetical protein